MSRIEYVYSGGGSEELFEDGYEVFVVKQRGDEALRVHVAEIHEIHLDLKQVFSAFVRRQVLGVRVRE